MLLDPATLQTIRFEKSGHIGIVTMDRPKQRNAQNFRMRTELVDAFNMIASDPDIWVGVLTGSGSAFSAGGDLKEVVSETDDVTDPGGSGVYAALIQVEKPMVAAINGPCIAQGAGLAFLCDLRVASETAYFCWPNVKRGFVSVSGAVILARHAPLAIVLEHIFTGEPLSVRDAERLGLINSVCAEGAVLANALSLCERVVVNAPLALSAVKKTYLTTRFMALEDALIAGDKIAKAARSNRDAKEGIEAFAEKRSPTWQGR